MSQITKIWNQIANITTDSLDIKNDNQGILWTIPHTCTFGNWEEMDQFLTKHKLPQLTQYKVPIWIALNY